MYKFALFVSALAIAGLVTLAGTSHAQYPPPTGSVSAGVDDPTAEPDSNVLLTCDLRTVSGDPIVGVPCDFLIESEPGSDAALGSKAITKITDANGHASASLYTGTSPGVIVVRMSAAGMSSVVVVNVSGAASLPPAAPLGQILPPSTGDAGIASR